MDHLITVADLAERIHDGRLRIVDCRFDLADTDRGEQAYRQGHVPGAVYAHLDHVLSAPITANSGRHPLPDPAALIEWLGQQGIDKDTTVVAYDDSGGTMAVRLWWLLRWLGHSRVMLLDGGWPAWSAAGETVEATLPEIAPTTFAGVPDPQLVLTTDELMTVVGDDMRQLLLIDARTSERFRGEVEPIDPVAGHVPGAINLPLQHHLDGAGRFLPADRLLELYGDIVGNRSPSDVAAMCGSGVTACHTLFAMEIAGFARTRLYAGSWSEWIRDPGRPVATGGN